MGYVLADRIARRDLPMSHAMKTTLVFMAFWADDDGRNTRPAAATLGDALIHDQRTVEHTTAELVADGWLKDDKPRFVGHAKNRRIDVELVDSYPVIDHDELRRIETFVELVRYAVKLVERAKSEGSEANFEAARAAVRAAQEAREDRRHAGLEAVKTGTTPVLQDVKTGVAPGKTGVTPGKTGVTPPDTVKTQSRHGDARRRASTSPQRSDEDDREPWQIVKDREAELELERTRPRTPAELAELARKRAHVDAINAAETARRDAELEASMTPEDRAAAQAMLDRLGIAAPP